MADLKSLIILAQAGHLDAFDKIVRQFQDMAVGYAYSILRGCVKSIGRPSSRYWVKEG